MSTSFSPFNVDDSINHDLFIANKSKSIFPILDILYAYFPMWITRNRSSMIINIIGYLITISYALYTIIDALCLSCLSKSDVLSIINSASLNTIRLIETLRIICIPLSMIAQLLFYFKTFTYFWTNDIRDNSMIKLLTEKDEIFDKYFNFKHISCIRNKSETARLRLFILSVFIVHFILLTIWLLISYIFCPFFDGQYSEILWYLSFPANIYFNYIPRILNCTVMFLYLFEWKCRLRYFWKYTFKLLLKEKKLLNNYKSMRKSLMKQLIWIKLYMLTDALYMGTDMWLWSYIIFDNPLKMPKSQFIWIVFQFIGCMGFYGVGFVLMFLSAASLTYESSLVFEYCIHYLHKLSPSNAKKEMKLEEINDEPEDDGYHGYDGMQIRTAKTETIMINKKNKVNGAKKHKKLISQSYNEQNRERNISGSSLVGKRFRSSFDVDLNNDSYFGILPDMKIENRLNILKNEVNNNNVNGDKILTTESVSNKQMIEIRKERIAFRQMIQTFLMYFNEKPCEFKLIGIKISYDTLFNSLLLFIIFKVFDYLGSTV